MMKTFYQRLAVAIVSYILFIPGVYLFVKKVYGLGDFFAVTCVIIAVLLTLPVLAVRSVGRYRELRSRSESDLPALNEAHQAAGGLLIRGGLALLGTMIAVWGALGVVPDHRAIGAVVSIGGIVIVASAAVSIVRLR